MLHAAAAPRAPDAMDIDIRAIDPQHEPLAPLYELVRDVYTTSDQMSETFAEKFPAPAALAAEIDDVCGRPGAVFLVATAGGRLQGYVALKPRRPERLRHTADLQLGVRSGARGQRIGTALLRAALDRAAHSGVVELVYLMVRADNLPAIRLYATTGFDRLATLQRDLRIDGRDCDGVLMRRFVGLPAAAGR